MKKNFYLIGGQLLLFLCILLVLTQLFPLLPFDGDDWRYLGGMRQPIPLWGAWNPTRVMPEVLMPTGGAIAAFLIYPITGDYVGALTFVESFIEAIFIFAMLYAFYKVSIKRFKLSKWAALACEVLFFMSFFFVFKKFNQPSYSGFWAADLTCVFYYIIPGLLNLTLVLYMMQEESFMQYFKSLNNKKKGFFLLLVYFAIFSNTQLNIIIASFCSVKLLEIFYKAIRVRKFNNIVTCSWLYATILVFWILTVIFDLNGKRAKYVSSANEGSFLINFIKTWQQFINFIKEQNIFIIGILIFVLISSLVIATIQWKKLSLDYVKLIGYVFFCFLCSLVYLLLAYTKAGSSYAGRPDAMWAVISLFLLGVNLAVVFYIKMYAALTTFIPLICVVIAIFSFNVNERLVYAANADHDPITIKKIDNYIINQIITADRKGKASVVVKVPRESEDATPEVTTSNWPHPYNMAVWLQNTLYSHHIIRTRMRIVFKPDSKVNKQFYENTSEQQPFFPPE